MPTLWVLLTHTQQIYCWEERCAHGHWALAEILTVDACDELWVGLQLLWIEEELGDKAVYAGASFRKPSEPYWIHSRILTDTQEFMVGLTCVSARRLTWANLFEQAMWQFGDTFELFQDRE